MDENEDYLPGFLAYMGIPAEVRRDARYIAVIVFETTLFRQRQAWIETGFELVEEQEDFCYCRERTRGSEDTLTSNS
jgi:hypothetical protein